jgi:hypothetical protein
VITHLIGRLKALSSAIWDAETRGELREKLTQLDALRADFEALDVVVDEDTLADPYGLSRNRVTVVWKSEPRAVSLPVHVIVLGRKP